MNPFAERYRKRLEPLFPELTFHFALDTKEAEDIIKETHEPMVLKGDRIIQVARVVVSVPFNANDTETK